MEAYALICDFKYCTGCHTCEIACRNEHDIPVKEWGIKITEYGPERLGGEYSWNYAPMLSQLCDMCEERMAAGKKPACAHHCLAQCLEAVPVAQLSEAMARYGQGALCIVPPVVHEHPQKR